MGGLRLETIVHYSAMARLQHEFGWPREHLVCESPSLVVDGHEVLHQDALDILLLEEPCSALTATMPVAVARSRVGIEAKATAKLLDKLLDGMRACEMFGRPHDKTDHKKCLAIAELRPHLFLGVAAGETWRLFTVVERNGRAVLGKELPGLDKTSLRVSARTGLARPGRSRHEFVLDTGSQSRAARVSQSLRFARCFSPPDALARTATSATSATGCALVELESAGRTSAGLTVTASPVVLRAFGQGAALSWCGRGRASGAAAQ